MSTEVVIVPTGTANTASVRAAFQRIGADLRPAESANDIQRADQLVLPGVGAFAADFAAVVAELAGLAGGLEVIPQDCIHE